MTTAAARIATPLDRFRSYEPIGLDVWYHDPALANRQQPRAAKITGLGGRAGTYNVTVFPDKLLDIIQGGQAPVLTRRDVVFLEKYPETGFPLEGFCVLPQTAMEDLKARADADNPPPTRGSDGNQPAAGRPSPSPAPKPGKKPAGASPGSAAGNAAGAGGGKPSNNGKLATPPPPPPPPPPADPAAAGPKDMQRGPINKLLGHPAWDRELPVDYKGRRAQTEEGLDFISATGIYLVRIDFVYNGQGPKPGYRLKGHGPGKPGKLSIIVEGANDNNAIRHLVVLAARTAALGAEAKSAKEAAEALQKAKESFEEGLQVPPDSEASQLEPPAVTHHRPRQRRASPDE